MLIRRAEHARARPVGEPSPSEIARVKSLRPWFLVAAMVLTWLAGVHGVTTGCGTVMFLRGGALPDDAAAIEAARSAADPVQGLMQYVPIAHLRAIGEATRAMLPVHLAKAILGMVLVAASAMVIAGRRGARALIGQALAVCAVYSVIAYVVGRGVRDAWVDAVVRLAATLTLPPEAQDFGRANFWYWIARTQLLVLELGVLGVAALAVGMPRSQAYLAAAEALEAQRDDESPGRDDDDDDA